MSGTNITGASVYSHLSEKGIIPNKANISDFYVASYDLNPKVCENLKRDDFCTAVWKIKLSENSKDGIYKFFVLAKNKDTKIRGKIYYIHVQKNKLLSAPTTAKSLPIAGLNIKKSRSENIVAFIFNILLFLSLVVLGISLILHYQPNPLKHSFDFYAQHESSFKEKLSSRIPRNANVWRKSEIMHHKRHLKKTPKTTKPEIIEPKKIKFKVKEDIIELMSDPILYIEEEAKKIKQLIHEKKIHDAGMLISKLVSYYDYVPEKNKDEYYNKLNSLFKLIDKE